MRLVTLLAVLVSAPLTYGQNCSGCTMNINGTTTMNANVYPGNVLCIQSGSEIQGNIYNYGGIVCNDGLISGNYIQYAGTLNNYNEATATSQCIINEGVVNNYETINSYLMAVHGADVTIHNYGILSPNAIDFTGDSLAQTSILHNYGTVNTVDFHADTTTVYNYGSFYTSESIHVDNEAYFYSYGILETGMNFYNNWYTQVYCMANIGGDLFNNGESSGPPFGCGGFNVAGNAFNNGDFGTNSLPLDLCKTAGSSGFNGSLGTIGSNVSYCVCANVCSPQTVSIEALETQPTERTLVKIVDLTGREVDDASCTTLIYVYSDGTTEKVFRME